MLGYSADPIMELLSYGLGFLLIFCVNACGTSHAGEASPPNSMTCKVMSFDGTQGRRCENEEATCYIMGDELSCIRK